MTFSVRPAAVRLALLAGAFAVIAGIGEAATAQSGPDRQGPGPTDVGAATTSSNPRPDAAIPVGPPGPVEPSTSASATTPSSTGEAAASPAGDVALGRSPLASGAETQTLVELDGAARPGRLSGRQLADRRTTLLNRFSQLGFAEVSAFRREGENYVTQATTVQGETVSVLIDPIAGTVVARR